MAFGKLGAHGGFGTLGGGGSSKGPFGGRISATINLAGDIRQSNLIGAVISGVVALAADISLAAGVQIGTIISGTLALAADAIQTNLIGTAISGTVNVAGDIASASAWDYDAEYMLTF